MQNHTFQDLHWYDIKGKIYLRKYFNTIKHKNESRYKTSPTPFPTIRIDLTISGRNWKGKDGYIILQAMIQPLYVYLIFFLYVFFLPMFKTSLFSKMRLNNINHVGDSFCVIMRGWPERWIVLLPCSEDGSRWLSEICTSQPSHGEFHECLEVCLALFEIPRYWYHTHYEIPAARIEWMNFHEQLYLNHFQNFHFYWFVIEIVCTIYQF